MKKAPRGYKFDEFDQMVSDLLFKNDLFLDHRSMVMHKDELVDDRWQRSYHLKLFGLDKKMQRERVFRKWKKCAVCRQPVTPERDEWHHSEPCDCLHGAEARCSQFVRDCHRHHTEGFKRHANG